MQTIKMKGQVGEDRTLVLTLPATVRTGMVDVIVLIDEPSDTPTETTEDAFAELMAFHKGQRLDGLSLAEMAREGCR